MPGPVSADRQILVAGQGPAPLSYAVANVTELEPLVIRALFDGTSAGGAFLPAVEIVSDGGVVVATLPCESEVLSGGTAEVTWAPGLSGAAGATVALSQQAHTISVAATAVVVAAVAGHRIRVVQAALMSDAATTARFTGTGDLTGAFPLAANTGFVLGPVPEGRYWFQTDVSAALTLTLSSAANVGGVLGYELV